jgi:hypothetical protein
MIHELFKADEVNEFIRLADKNSDETATIDRSFYKRLLAQSKREIELRDRLVKILTIEGSATRAEFAERLATMPAWCSMDWTDFDKVIGRLGDDIAASVKDTPPID